MSKTIRELIDTPEKERLLLVVFEGYIKKCHTYANTPVKVYGKATELENKKRWAARAEEAEKLLSTLMNELI
jgi:hypothetical protein